MKQPHFTDQIATLNHVALNRLKIGKTGAPGVTLSITIQTGNDALDMLHADLKQSLFRKPGKGEQIPLEGTTEGVSAGLVALKLPGIEPIKIEGKWEHYEMQLDGLLEGTEALPFVDVSIKDFTVDAIEGGSVLLSFKASNAIDLSEVADLVDFWMNEGIKLTLTPPAEKPQDSQDD